MPRKKIKKVRKKSKLTIDVFEYYGYLAGKQDTENVKFKKPDWLVKAKEITEKMTDDEYDEWLEKAIEVYKKGGVRAVLNLKPACNP